MVSLADAKRHLGNDLADDVVARLVAAATQYLERIGVETDPEPAPVGEAILLLAGIFCRRAHGDFGLRHEEVDGVGSSTYFDPKMIDDADLQVIKALVDPYREMSL